MPVQAARHASAHTGLDQLLEQTLRAMFEKRKRFFIPRKTGLKDDARDKAARIPGKYGKTKNKVN